MPNVTRLNHAVLYVSNLDRSVEFYKKAFGFEEIDHMGDQMASSARPAPTITTTSA